MGQSVVPGPTTARATALLITTVFVFVGGGITATVVALLAIVIGIVGVEHRGGATLGRALAGIRVLSGLCLFGVVFVGVGRTDGQRARQHTRTHVDHVRGVAREVGQDEVGQRHVADVLHDELDVDVVDTLGRVRITAAVRTTTVRTTSIRTAYLVESATEGTARIDGHTVVRVGIVRRIGPRSARIAAVLGAVTADRGDRTGREVGVFPDTIAILIGIHGLVFGQIDLRILRAIAIVAEIFSRHCAARRSLSGHCTLVAIQRFLRHATAHTQHRGVAGGREIVRRAARGAVHGGAGCEGGGGTGHGHALVVRHEDVVQGDVAGVGDAVGPKHGVADRDLRGVTGVGVVGVGAVGEAARRARHFDDLARRLLRVAVVAEIGGGDVRLAVGRATHDAADVFVQRGAGGVAAFAEFGGVHRAQQVFRHAARGAVHGGAGCEGGGGTGHGHAVVVRHEDVVQGDVAGVGDAVGPKHGVADRDLRGVTGVGVVGVCAVGEAARRARHFDDLDRRGRGHYGDGHIAGDLNLEVGAAYAVLGADGR